MTFSAARGFNAANELVRIRSTLAEGYRPVDPRTRAPVDPWLSQSQTVLLPIVMGGGR